MVSFVKKIIILLLYKLHHFILFCWRVIILAINLQNQFLRHFLLIYCLIHFLHQSYYYLPPHLHHIPLIIPIHSEFYLGYFLTKMGFVHFIDQLFQLEILFCLNCWSFYYFFKVRYSFRNFYDRSSYHLLRYLHQKDYPLHLMDQNQLIDH